MGKKKKLPYPEGTWFAVPLQGGGFAIGLLARLDGRGSAFGYFFGPKRNCIPDIRDIDTLTYKDAIVVALFGDLGLLNGEWPVIGKPSQWDRNEWPLPPFVRVDEMENKAWMACYSDKLELLSDEPCDPALAKTFPEDA